MVKGSEQATGGKVHSAANPALPNISTNMTAQGHLYPAKTLSAVLSKLRHRWVWLYAVAARLFSEPPSISCPPNYVMLPRSDLRRSLRCSARFGDTNVSIWLRAMLQAQLPTVNTRRALRRSIKLKASADINDSRIPVLVVKLLYSEDVNDTQDWLVNKPPEDSEIDRNGQFLQRNPSLLRSDLVLTIDKEYVEPP